MDLIFFVTIPSKSLNLSSPLVSKQKVHRFFYKKWFLYKKLDSLSRMDESIKYQNKDTHTLMNTFLLNTGDHFNIEEKAIKETDKSIKFVYEFKNNQVVFTAMVIGSEIISEEMFLRRD